MAQTFDPALPTDKDWVRQVLGDTTVAGNRAKLEDETIVAILALEPNKWLAAARLGDSILAKRQGVTSKTVGNLSLSFGGGSGGDFAAAVQRLREEGARQLLKRSGSHVLRTL
jgi:hypothetical protein